MSMTVGELIEELQKFPSDKDVFCLDSNGWHYFDVKTVFNETGAVVIEYIDEGEQE